MTLQGRTHRICVREVVKVENFRRGNRLAYVVEPWLEGNRLPLNPGAGRGRICMWIRLHTLLSRVIYSNKSQLSCHMRHWISLPLKFPSGSFGPAHQNTSEVLNNDQSILVRALLNTNKTLWIFHRLAQCKLSVWEGFRILKCCRPVFREYINISVRCGNKGEPNFILSFERFWCLNSFASQDLASKID